MHVVSNSSPIILLSRVGLLDLLPKLFDRVTIPGAVFREVVEQGADLPGSKELAGAKWARIVEHEPSDPLALSLGAELGEGEVAALTVARSLQADLVVIDERQGRRAARRLGLAVKGTVGVLVLARKLGEIDELRPELEALAKEGAWISPSLLRAALIEVGEEETEASSS